MLGHSLTLAKLLLHLSCHNCSSASSAPCLALWSAKIHLSYSTAAHRATACLQQNILHALQQQSMSTICTCRKLSNEVCYHYPPVPQRLLLSSASDWLIAGLPVGLADYLPIAAFTAVKSVNLVIFIGKLTIFTRTHISCVLFGSTEERHLTHCVQHFCAKHQPPDIFSQTRKEFCFMLCIYIVYIFLFVLAYTSTDRIAFHCVWDYVCSYLSAVVFALLNTLIIALLPAWSSHAIFVLRILGLGGMVFIRLLNTF